MPWLNNNVVNKDAPAGDLIQKNLFTGIGTVNIPLYSYSNYNISTGVSLEYATDGIKVDRISSTVGIGWELFTGGEITRQVVGVEDEININHWCGTVFYVPYWERRGYWVNSKDTAKTDNAPDIFSLKLSDRKINFQFSKTGELFTIPKSSVKIERYVNGSLLSGQLDSTTDYTGDLTFKVTDESGNQYFFKKGDVANDTNSVDLSFASLPSCQQIFFPADKWVLDKIITYDGLQIGYFYDQISYTEVQHKSQVLREVNNDWSNVEEKIIKNSYTAQRLTRIEYPNNINVQFSYDVNSRCDLKNSFRLKEVLVTERTLTYGLVPQTQKYVFNQAYFVSPDSSMSTLFSSYGEYPISTNCNQFDDKRFRLKLKSIDMIAQSQSRNLFNFEYAGTDIPQRVCGGRDLYGYPSTAVPILQTCNNGTFSLMVPVHHWPDASHYAGMSLAPEIATKFIQAGALKKIITGSGAEYKLGYGLNAVSISGLSGLRLDTLSVYDGYNHDNDLYTTFTYEGPEVFVPEKAINYTYYQEGGEFNQPGHPYYLNNVWSSSSCLVNNSLDGANYGYKKVTECNWNSNGQQLNKTITQFSGSGATTAVNQGTDNNLMAPANVFNDNNFYVGFSLPPYSNKQYLRSWGIGLPIRREYYDYNNQLVKTEDLSYTVTTLPKQDVNFRAIVKLPSKKKNTDEPLEFYRDVYYPTTGLSYLNSILTRNYTTATSYSESNVAYAYDSHNNLQNTILQNSLSQNIKEVKYYNYNWNGNTPNPGTAINKMNQDGIEKLIYTETWKSNIDLSGSGQYSLINLATPAFSVNNNIIRPQYEYRLAVSDPLPSSIYTGNSSLDMNSLALGNTPATNFIKTGENSLFDDKGNVLETKEPRSNLYSASIWDNEAGFKLAAVKNARYNEIAYCGFESNYIPGTDYRKGNWDFNISGLAGQSAMLGRGSFQLGAGGLWTTTNLTIGKRYVVSFWVYQGGSADANDGVTPLNIQPSGVSYNGWNLYEKEFTAQSAGIGVWGSGYIDEVRLYPANSQMINYNFLPLIGKTAVVDPNDRITTYEHDGFGRETLIRDQNRNILNKVVNAEKGND
ncbi:hypothetical protein DN068_01035 [Taibaiella soli]|uniref:Uncharacterized protein n=1 Tax=Taibaiella soli TaxID=1649169 RepID=A0A2W2AMP9_9BACT|nr:hypothetical protein DN068_01035 [Taibaiella soli]